MCPDGVATRAPHWSGRAHGPGRAEVGRAGADGRRREGERVAQVGERIASRASSRCIRRFATVAHTSMRDVDSGAPVTLAEATGRVRLPPMVAPACGPRDWPSLYEQAQARADAAEARCEELRRAEIDARSRAGLPGWSLDKSRDKLKAAIEEVEVGR